MLLTKKELKYLQTVQQASKLLTTTFTIDRKRSFSTVRDRSAKTKRGRITATVEAEKSGVMET